MCRGSVCASVYAWHDRVVKLPVASGQLNAPNPSISNTFGGSTHPALHIPYCIICIFPGADAAASVEVRKHSDCAYPQQIKISLGEQQRRMPDWYRMLHELWLHLRLNYFPQLEPQQ